ncbi:MAG TPA: hypothetical protein PKD32_11450 [Saprospiraceae bacterium]|nr:hypothetical protein [Saprospiraceae bacterium]
MNIEIHNYDYFIPEDYSNFDSDDLNSIANSIFKQIDKLKIATFNSCFSKYDDIFVQLDFAYDFGSIACELKNLELFLEAKKGKFILLLYENNRIIEFIFHETSLNFKLINISKIGHEYTVAMGEIEYNSFRSTILKLRSDFELLLKLYFPIAHNILKKQNYII